MQLNCRHGRLFMGRHFNVTLAQTSSRNRWISSYLTYTHVYLTKMAGCQKGRNLTKEMHNACYYFGQHDSLYGTLIDVPQVGSMRTIQVRRWSTEWRATSKWIVVWSAWSTVRCHRSVTLTTTVLLTKPASSTHMPLHSAPTRSTLSLTAPGPGGVRTSATSSKQHKCRLHYNHCMNLTLRICSTQPYHICRT